MINFTIKLEDMLKNSGYEDWEIQYHPEDHSYVLILDGDKIRMTKADD